MNGNGQEQALGGIQFDAAVTGFSVKKVEGQSVTEFKVSAPLSPEQTYALHRLMYTIVTFAITESEVALRTKGGKIVGQTEWIPEEAPKPEPELVL